MMSSLQAPLKLLKRQTSIQRHRIDRIDQNVGPPHVKRQGKRTNAETTCAETTYEHNAYRCELSASAGFGAAATGNFPAPTTGPSPGQEVSGGTCVSGSEYRSVPLQAGPCQRHCGVP